MLQVQSVMPAGRQRCCNWQCPVEVKAISKSLSEAAAKPQSVVSIRPLAAGLYFERLADVRFQKCNAALAGSLIHVCGAACPAWAGHSNHPQVRLGTTQCQSIHLRYVMHAGRHVLTELVKDPFVPNDTRMELNTGRIQVCPHPEGLPHPVSLHMQVMAAQAWARPAA